MKFYKIILTIFTFGFMAASANAAVVSTINGLDIGGTLYDVTIHNNPEMTFNELWDSNDDGIFGNDSSVFNAQPIFWGNQALAISAVQAIITHLGVSDITSFNQSSDFAFVPYGFTPSGSIQIATDGNPAPGIDVTITALALDNENAKWVSFEAAVPVPAAAWLFASGLLGLVGFARRKA